MKKEIVSLATFYAISPVHAGSGTSTAAVDLPIQRERHTNWPHIQASGVKGAFRAHYRNNAPDSDPDMVNYIFGSDEQDGWSSEKDALTSAVSFSDAKLLLFPVRSNIYPFVWVTCSSVLNRLSVDLEYTKTGELSPIEPVQEDDALFMGDGLETGSRVVLEDAAVTVKEKHEQPFLKKLFPDIQRILIVSDKMYAYLVGSCTEVQTQVKISSETGAAEDGALRYEELLPADSVLYAIVHYSSQSPNGGELKASEIQKNLESLVTDFVQVGGDVTLGRGICQLNWVQGGQR